MCVADDTGRLVETSTDQSISATPRELRRPVRGEQITTDIPVCHGGLHREGGWSTSCQVLLSGDPIANRNGVLNRKKVVKVTTLWR